MTLYSKIFVFLLQCCALYAMETDGLYFSPHLDSNVLSSVRQLVKSFDNDLARKYIPYAALRRDFEQKNKALLDQVSIDSLQKYLVDLPLEHFDDKLAPWIVNYWYDHIEDPLLIKSLSKKLMSEDITERLKQDSSDEVQDFVVDLNGNSGNGTAISDVSKLAVLVKKYAYSVKEMYYFDSNSIIGSPVPVKETLCNPGKDTDTLFIQDAFLRTLDGIEDVINEKMTDEEKNFIRFIYFDGNKLHFPDAKRIKNLFLRLQKISYKDNPLRYIDEKDFDMPVGFELGFYSTHYFVDLPITRLSTTPYLQILFNKKKLTDEQIISLQSLSYDPDRGYYFKRNGSLELLGIGFLTSGVSASIGAIFMALNGSFEHALPAFSLFGALSVLLTAGVGNVSIAQGRGLCCYSSPYAEHKVILSE